MYAQASSRTSRLRLPAETMDNNPKFRPIGDVIDAAEELRSGDAEILAGARQNASSALRLVISQPHYDLGTAAQRLQRRDDTKSPRGGLVTSLLHPLTDAPHLSSLVVVAVRDATLLSVPGVSELALTVSPAPKAARSPTSPE